MIKKLMFAALALAMLGPVVNGQAADLANRWSFNGNLVDSVGGKDAAIVELGPNNATLSDTQVILAGGGKDTSDYVDLPDRVMSSLGDSATIEVWATQQTIQNWSRIWDFGSSTAHNVFMSFTRGTNLAQDRVSWTTPAHSATKDDSVAPLTLGTEFHIVCVFQPGVMTWYAAPAGAADLGAPQGSFETTNLLSGLDDTNVWIGRSQWPDNTAGAGYNELRFWKGALTLEELEILHDLGPERLNANIALSPVPANGAANVLPDVVLSWRPGDDAKTHDVYFGTSFDDVMAATAADPRGVLVSASQEAATFDVGQLKLGATYYWRVDEIGPGPDFTMNKGDVWRFTIEPVAYTLGKAAIKATASSSNDATMGPEKTIDGSGLNPAGEHSVVETDMWLSSATGSQPTWIQYEFDQVYALADMLVWNSNGAMEFLLGYGAKAVTVEYSADGAAWTKLGDVEFARAPGAAGYKANTTVAFGGVPAKFVKLTINSNWGGLLAQYGLSEVQFSYIPVKATNLTPASGTINLDSPVTLSWRPGRQVVTHEVYLGTDPANLSLAATTEVPTYVAAVDVGKVYYWKVVEVNEAAATPRWESAVANFSTVAVPTNPGTDNLAHLWTFNDGTANDSVGAADGTLVGGAAIVDGAMVTSAQDQWMEMPGKDIALNTYEAASIVAWYTPKAGANGGWSMLAYFGDSVNGLGSNGYFLTSARGDNVSRTGISIGDVATPWASESGANGPEYDDGKPHLMVSTIDATTIKLYIDGVLTASTPLSATNKISGISQNFAYLAKGGYSGDPEWIGAIHEFSIYNKALSGGEVLYLAQLVPQGSRHGQSEALVHLRGRHGQRQRRHGAWQAGRRRHGCQRRPGHLGPGSMDGDGWQGHRHQHVRSLQHRRLVYPEGRRQHRLPHAVLLRRLGRRLRLQRVLLHPGPGR